MIARRAVLQLAGAALGLAAAGVFVPAPAFALAEDQAKALVQQTVDEVLDLVQAPGSGEEKSARLRSIMERRAALPQIARFAAGPVWRGMSEDQQDRFVDAFSDYISKIYARRFQEYSGEKVIVSRAVDAGRKGILIESSVSQPRGGQPIPVSWLVTDRGGEARIADIIIEGVSMVTTQRDEVGAMFDRNGADVDKLIDALRSA